MRKREKGEVTSEGKKRRKERRGGRERPQPPKEPGVTARRSLRRLREGWCSPRQDQMSSFFLPLPFPLKPPSGFRFPLNSSPLSSFRAVFCSSVSFLVTLP